MDISSGRCKLRRLKGISPGTPTPGQSRWYPWQYHLKGESPGLQQALWMLESFDVPELLAPLLKMNVNIPPPYFLAGMKVK